MPAVVISHRRAVENCVTRAAPQSGVAPRIQRGFVRSYALAFLLGAVALLLFLGLRA